MQPRQTDLPEQWLIVDARLGDEMLTAVRRLPRGSGILLLCHDLPAGKRERMRRALGRLARSRGLLLVDEAAGGAARVHDARELARARLRGSWLILLSPVFATRSHPEWPAMPRMRAASLARLAGGPVLALGGMDARRFTQVRRLGFTGWAGIDAWMKSTGRD